MASEFIPSLSFTIRHKNNKNNKNNKNLFFSFFIYFARQHGYLWKQ